MDDSVGPLGNLSPWRDRGGPRSPAFSEAWRDDGPEDMLEDVLEDVSEHETRL
jgi:hypothetical protein